MYIYLTFYFEIRVRASLYESGCPGISQPSSLCQKIVICLHIRRARPATAVEILARFWGETQLFVFILKIDGNCFENLTFVG